ncbi:MAG: PHP domain-containing protein [Chloroflexi bacterium]|nr:PHP domain-containing protein [Chloroflexota bacterium]
MLKADLHIHTEYSFDCTTPLEDIIDRCVELGINCVAVADHGTIAGALKMKERAPFKVIVAEEVLTPIGEIMGMFLSEEVPTKISAEEAIRRIKGQNGLVCLPHPFDRMRGIKEKCRSLESLIPDIDIIEVFNARTLPLLFSDSKARRFAEKHGLLCSAGSDAHTLHEVGHTWVEMPEFNGSQEFRSALAQGTIHGHRSSPVVHVATTYRNILRGLKLAGRRPSG